MVDPELLKRSAEDLKHAVGQLGVVAPGCLRTRQSPEKLLVALGLVPLLIGLVYCYVFYRLTFVPPKQ